MQYTCKYSDCLLNYLRSSMLCQNTLESRRLNLSLDILKYMKWDCGSWSLISWTKWWYSPNSCHLWKISRSHTALWLRLCRLRLRRYSATTSKKRRQSLSFLRRAIFYNVVFTGQEWTGWGFHPRVAWTSSACFNIANRWTQYLALCCGAELSSATRRKVVHHIVN